MYVIMIICIYNHNHITCIYVYIYHLLEAVDNDVGGGLGVLVALPRLLGQLLVHLVHDRRLLS